MKLLVAALLLTASLTLFAQEKAKAPVPIAKPSLAFLSGWQQYDALAKLADSKRAEIEQKCPGCLSLLVSYQDELGKLEKPLISEMEKACTEAGKSGCRYDPQKGIFVVPEKSTTNGKQ